MGNFIEKIQQLADQIANNHQLSTEFIYNKIGDILVDMNIATFVKDYKPKYNAELFDMITNVLEAQGVPSQKNYYMINSNKDEYSLNHFENNFISKRIFISYMISDCDQVITQENVTDFAKSFEALVLAIFPEGHNSNAKARKCQKEDFSLSVTPNRPLLEHIKESKEFLINTLISKLTKLGFVSLSIQYHKKYRELFYIPATTLLSYFKSIKHLECLEINDLAYLKQISSQSILHFNCNEQFFNARNTILKFIDSLGDCDKKCLQVFKHPFKILQKDTYEKIKNAMTIEQIKDEYNEIKEDLDIIYDNHKHIFNINNQSALYYLSILHIECSNLFASGHDNVYLSFKSFEEYFDKVMPQKLAKFSDTIEKDEQQNLLKRFCQSGIDWLKEFPSPPTNNCENEKRLTMCKMLHGINFNETTLFTPIRNSKSLITFDDFYNALNQMPFLKKIVIAAQNRIEMFEKNANFIDGDYTWLVCTQIKLIERYLKLVILHNPDWKIYKTKNSALCTNNNNEFVTLTPSNDARLIDVESGGLICGLQYHYFQNNTNTYSTNLPWFLKGYYYNRNRNVTREFFPQRDTVVTTNCPLYLSFTQGFRNGFFHTEPVKDFETAKNISKGVAYWLACCMKHYGVVHDMEI